MRVIVYILIIVIALCVSVIPEDRSIVNEAVGTVRTRYGADGRPANQVQQNKGLHQVVGLAALASGRVTITLNTSTVDGRQDVSFMSDSTYRGIAWSMDTSNTNTYKVYALTGSTILIKSSDGADTSTILYRLEGE